MKSIYLMLIRHGGTIFKLNGEPASGFYLKFAADPDQRGFFISQETFDDLFNANYLTKIDPGEETYFPNMNHLDVNAPIIPAGDFIAYMNQQVPPDVDLSQPVSNTFNRVHAISIFDAFRLAFEFKEHLIAGYDIDADRELVIKQLSAMLGIYYSQEEIRRRYEQRSPK